MHFETLSLECFVAIAETKSFTRAARNVNRTQSAVSQQISKLETQIGAQLFRRGKNFSLTPEGEILLHYAKQILHLQREAYGRFNQVDLQGEVRFGLPEDFASVFLSQVLSEYASLHPLVNLHIECDLTVPLFNRFIQKEFDLVLVKMNRPEDFPNGIDVWSESLEWVSRKESLYTAYESNVSLVLAPSPCVYRSRAIESLDKKGVSWRIAFSSQSYAGMIAAVRAGMGITVLPRNMIPNDLVALGFNTGLPRLQNTHISLIKHESSNSAVNSLEKFVIQSLRV